MGIWYRAGTVAVTLNNPVVTGTLTLWNSQARAGDTFKGPDGKDYEILTVDNNTQITLATNYLGSTASGAAHEIKPYSPLRSAVAALSLQIANFLQTVKGIYGGTGAPSNAVGVDGDYYFRDDVPKLHKKTSGAWDAGVALTGPAGPIGPGSSTTSATSITIGTGIKVFTIPGTSGASYMGLRMRAARTADPTKYVEGIVTATTSNTITINVTGANASDVGGSGTFTDWSIGVTGNPGAQGPIGAASTGTSTSSVTIGTGTKTFTVPTSLDLALGQRVRFVDAANPATNWIEGPIISYSGTSLSISVANDGLSTAGSGTITLWSFGIIGARGLTGPTGAASTVPGPIGPSYSGTSTTSLAIGTGNKTLTTQTGLAYLPGARSRLADQAAPQTNYMEGEVTAYNTATGSMTVAVDYVPSGASGTFTAWNLVLAGDRGAAGLNGTSIVNRGDYSAGTAYAIGDVVQDQSSSWIALIATTGNAPPTLPTLSNTQWKALAVKGTDGLGTVNSVNGVLADVGNNVPLGAADIPAGFTPTGYAVAGGGVLDHLQGIDAAVGANALYTTSSLASAGTVDIGAANSREVVITGTTTITSFGTVASKLRHVRFSGALTLTHNATSLILPGAANLITAAGDTALFGSDASGNWRCLFYARATPVGPIIRIYTASATWTRPANCKKIRIRCIGGGGGGGGAQASASNLEAGCGGGGGGYSETLLDVAAVSSAAVTIGAAGAAGAAAGGAGGAGGSTSFGAVCVAGGGNGGGVLASGSTVNVASGASGAAVGTGDITAAGSMGAQALRVSGSAGLSGSGATGPLGGGASGRAGQNPGFAATGYGAGGGGGLSTTTSGQAGGAGAPGLCIVEEFY